MNTAIRVLLFGNIVKFGFIPPPVSFFRIVDDGRRRETDDGRDRITD